MLAQPVMHSCDGTRWPHAHQGLIVPRLQLCMPGEDGNQTRGRSDASGNFGCQDGVSSHLLCSVRALFGTGTRLQKDVTLNSPANCKAKPVLTPS